MKPRSSQAKPDYLVRKVKVLRAYLAKYDEITEISLDVDSSLIRDGVRGGGSRFARMSGYLLPELLLCTSRNDTRAEFVIITETAEVIDATPGALDTWLAAQGRENALEDISKSLRVLQSAGSRLTSKTGQSEASKAINVLRRLLVNGRASSAA